jgi:hypothetical protein
MILERIIEIVTAVETADLQNLVSLTEQIPQKQLVDTFQSQVHENLKKRLPDPAKLWSH